MSGWLTGGVEIFVGKTRSGKTSFALWKAFELHRLSGAPVVVVDLAFAKNFKHLPHAKNVEEVCEDAFGRRVSPKIWSPRSEDERALFWELVAYYGGVIVVLDEIRKMCSPTHIEDGFANAVNMHGHGLYGPTNYYLTAQRPKYVHFDLWAALETLYLFCVARGRDAKTIEEHFEVPPSVSTVLGRGEYVPVELGFPPEPEPGSPAPPPLESNSDIPPQAGAGDEEKGAPQPDSPIPSPGGNVAP